MTEDIDKLLASINVKVVKLNTCSDKDWNFMAKEIINQEIPRLTEVLGASQKEKKINKRALELACVWIDALTNELDVRNGRGYRGQPVKKTELGNPDHWLEEARNENP